MTESCVLSRILQLRPKSGFQLQNYTITKSALVAVMIMIVPITITVPAMFVFVPPPMVFGPAPFPQFMQFTAFVIRLRTVAAMTLNGPMKIVLFVRDASLAPVTIICVKTRHGAENKSSCQSQNWQERLAGSDFIHGTPVFFPNRLKLIFGLGGHPFFCPATGGWACLN